MTVHLLGVLVGVVVPILNGLLTKQAETKLRAVLQLVLNSAAGLLAEWYASAQAGTAYDLKAAALTAGIALVTAIAVEAGVWSPLGVSAWAKSTGRA
ncbi:hypothetical protein [Saccharothrix variisporea]|uniref:Holin n=1 Tax=Saccharothrix variisporea TaxID=543527 RepID=A0A495WZJ1_9PSEU|nr:hypothetical protein [Saccharothrix variisporea]RKT67122.1 hypothetical protein DFJ66_0290 [Saccharothrix variisporea]